MLQSTLNFFLIKGQVHHVPVFKMAAIFKMAAVLSDN